jgi:hypothetical protein
MNKTFSYKTISFIFILFAINGKALSINMRKNSKERSFDEFIASNPERVKSFEILFPRLIPKCFADNFYRRSQLSIKDQELSKFAYEHCIGKTSEYWLYLISKYQNSEFDWFLNCVLYQNFSYFPDKIQKYAPNKIKEWRMEQKKIDFENWREFISGRNMQQEPCGCGYTSSFDIHGFDLGVDQNGKIYHIYQKSHPILNFSVTIEYRSYVNFKNLPKNSITYKFSKYLALKYTKKIVIP